MHPPAPGSPGPDQHYQLRMATVILTGINIASSVSLGARICWDAYNARTTSRDLEKAGLLTAPGWWELLSGKELFPLIFSIAVFAQGVMLAIVESQGLGGYRMCEQWAVVAWIATWIPSYTALVFIVDTGLRAVCSPRFKPRSIKRVFLIFCGLVLLLVLTMLPVWLRTWKDDRQVCSGELMMLVGGFASIGAVVLVAALLVTASLAAVICVNLSRQTRVDLEGRMSASRELYFIAALMLQWILLLPNFIVVSQGTTVRELSFLSAVVINTSGIIASTLHLYLRARNTFISGPPCLTEPPVVIDKAPSDFSSGDDDRPAGTSPQPRVRDSENALQPPKFPDRSRFSASTVGANNLHRLGEEITSLMAGLLSSPAPSSSPPPPRHRDTLPEPRHFRGDSDVSVVHAFDSTITSPKHAYSRVPRRPSRHGVPIVNVDREQNLGNSARRVELVKEVHSHTRTDSAKSLFDAVQTQSPKLGGAIGGRRCIF